MYTYIDNSLSHHRPIYFKPIQIMMSCVVLYTLELTLLLKKFEDVKTTATNHIDSGKLNSTTNNVGIIKVSEMFWIQQMHQNFTFRLYGTEAVDNTLLYSVNIENS